MFTAICRKNMGCSHIMSGAIIPVSVTSTASRRTR
nr:hypothetical protein [Ensifer adhaerens]